MLFCGVTSQPRLYIAAQVPSNFQSGWEIPLCPSARPFHRCLSPRPGPPVSSRLCCSFIAETDCVQGALPQISHSITLSCTDERATTVSQSHNCVSHNLPLKDTFFITASQRLFWDAVKQGLLFTMLLVKLGRQSYGVQGCDATGPRVLLQPSDDLQPVPTEFKSVIGHSQTEPSSGWRGETVLWMGADQRPYTLTVNKV